MEWHDEGIVLSVRPHGEKAAVVTLLTASHGRHAGLIARATAQSGMLQPGNCVKAKWRARLAEHLGHYAFEPVTNCAAWLDAPFALAIIVSACAVTDAALPERQPLPHVHEALQALLAVGDEALWGAAYVKWEIGLLAALGYGLDLTQCAVSGVADNLAYVSPRTGRAVSAIAAEPYRERLLPLPSFLLNDPDWDMEEVVDGLALTGHFLARHVFAHPQNRALVPRVGELPVARQRLAELCARAVMPVKRERAG